VINDLAISNQVTAATKQQLTGEAKFVRALTYFYLVNLFSDVPLVDTTDYQISGSLPRTSAAIIYQYIIRDLQDAQMLLSPQYATGQAASTDRTRPNQFAATALLARVYLYQSEWAKAGTAAGTVINAGMYRLESNLDNVFLSTSREAILQWQPVVARMNTSEGNVFIPSTDAGSKPTYTLTSFLPGVFEQGDQRRVHWIGDKRIGGKDYFYPFKYKIRSGGPPYSEYNMVLRFAEQYLIRAEARARLGDLAGAVADLGAVRKRAGLPGIAIQTTAALMKAIEKEERIEFLAEWGHRWLDLKRTGEADTVLRIEKTGWAASAIWYPIPLKELQKNSNLTQNAGY
jgi:hypothetical protein